MADATKRTVLISCGVAGFSSEVKALITGLDEDLDIVLAYPRREARVLQKRFRTKNFFITANVSKSRRKGNHKSPLFYIRSVLRCYRRIKRNPPRLAVFMGSSEGFPLMIACRLAGVKCVFIETITRVDKPSKMGLIVYYSRLCQHFLVQWPDMAEPYPRAQYQGVVYDIRYRGIDIL